MMYYFKLRSICPNNVKINAEGEGESSEQAYRSGNAGSRPAPGSENVSQQEGGIRKGYNIESILVAVLINM